MLEAQTPFTVACGEYTIACTPAGLPAAYDAFKQHARLAEEIDLDDSACCVWVTRNGEAWPTLVVAQGGLIHGAGFGVGALVVPETRILLLGAGERLLAYHLEPVGRLWEDKTELGFFDWKRHGDVIVMAAELELAAWDTAGSKLWTTFVEPPWSYEVNDGAVELDVMGTKRRFPLRTGPR